MCWVRKCSQGKFVVSVSQEKGVVKKSYSKFQFSGSLPCYSKKRIRMIRFFWMACNLFIIRFTGRKMKQRVLWVFHCVSWFRFLLTVDASVAILKCCIIQDLPLSRIRTCKTFNIVTHFQMKIVPVCWKLHVPKQSFIKSLFLWRWAKSAFHYATICLLKYSFFYLINSVMFADSVI